MTNLFDIRRGKAMEDLLILCPGPAISNLASLLCSDPLKSSRTGVYASPRGIYEKRQEYDYSCMSEKN